ncbi:MAG: hypothetical protein KF886_22415 [Candidatus Hydrogenedentes bacterium]|nr:hypothetical protein [Candidatus Hydrogenedentota bacterium]
MTADKSVNAIFEQLQLTVSKVGEGTVTPPGGGETLPHTITYGTPQTVGLTASPAAGWGFKEWTGDAGGENPSTSVVVNGEKSVTAVFEEIELKVEKEGDGEVNLNPPGTTQTPTFIQPYSTDTNVTLTAIPEQGWIFKEWTGDKTGTANPTSLMVDGKKAVTSVFEPCGITGGTVLSKRTSSPTEANLFPVKEGEQYEVGGTFQFVLDNSSPAPSSATRYEIQNMNSGTNTIGGGAGHTFSHTWQDGAFSTYLGNTRIRFYCDANGNEQYDSGEEYVFSSTFLVVRPRVIHFNVQVSDQIANPPNAEALLAEAQNVLLRKDDEEDWRAAVEYHVKSYSTYTPDPNDRPDVLAPFSSTSNSQHNTVAIPNTNPTEYCEISIIQSFDGGNSIPVQGGICNPLLGVRFVITMELHADDWAHEIGHGCGIGTHYTDPTNPLLYVMYAYWGSGSTHYHKSWLTSSHADFFN